MNGKSKPHIPADARINIKNFNSEPPKTKYEKRRVVLNRDIVKDKVTKRETP
jgi:hypothetical protein